MEIGSVYLGKYNCRTYERYLEVNYEAMPYGKSIHSNCWRFRSLDLSFMIEFELFLYAFFKQTLVTQYKYILNILIAKIKTDISLDEIVNLFKD